MQKNVSWKGSFCGHVWIAAVRSRTQRNSGCPICAKKRAAQKRHELFLEQNGSLCDPELLEAWDYEKNDPLRPEHVTAYSNESVWWKCKTCGHSWKAKISNRSHGRGCPACSNRTLVKGVNDLATCNPALAAEWEL